MLRYLMEHAGRPAPHNRLLISVWGPEYGIPREHDPRKKLAQHLAPIVANDGAVRRPILDDVPDAILPFAC
jgi:hypothetical protein